MKMRITKQAKRAQLLTPRAVMATPIAEITIADLDIETTIDEIVDVIVIEIATETVVTVKSGKLLLGQMMFCFQLVAY
jgi:hypothetical protein